MMEESRQLSFGSINGFLVSKETFNKVKKVNELLAAVEGVTETYTQNDRLENQIDEGLERWRGHCDI
jgi:hypothetical protein